MSESESGDEGFSMQDVLNEEIRLAEQTSLVLGATDDSNCTYPLGYVKRQPLYACLTCNPPNSANVGGFCLACSLNCHQGHDIVEMYTKRNFRCDCGNSRFPRNKCRLFADKEETNIDNRYNHNFNGIYCTCDRPYPDPDQEQQDDMSQCTVCEEWYHLIHLDVPEPWGEEYCELICARCVQKHPFLKLYGDEFGRKEQAEHEGVCREDWMKEGKVEVKSDAGGSQMGSSKGKKKSEAAEKCNGKKKSEASSGFQTENGKSKGISEVAGGFRSVFMPEGWRLRLCTCANCVSMYEEKGLEFLLDPEDTVLWYVQRGSARKQESLYNMAMQRLEEMNRLRRADLIQGYNEMQNNLKEYLRRFEENGKVVREEDIREFFDGLTKNKRRRLE